MITVEIEGPIARLTLNRPENLNALGAPGDGDAVAAACERVNADEAVRCAVLTGRGAAPSPRAAMSRPCAIARAPSPAAAWRSARAIAATSTASCARSTTWRSRWWRRWNGAAIGLGCDVACMADIRIASSAARFGVTFLKLGLIPGDGGAWLLPRTVGMSRAAEMLFTGDVVDAATAERWGLVSRVVAPEALMDEAMALAGRIAQQPPHALRMAKTLLRQGQVASYDTLMEMSAAAQGLAHTSDDHMEGVSALLEKRGALFTGR